MARFVNIGDKLFHKYLGVVTVTHVSDSIIKADTGARGVLDFAFYDFGRVLYFDKDHSEKSYSTYMEYVEFNEKDKIIKKENEAKIKREREQIREKIRLREIEEVLEIPLSPSKSYALEGFRKIISLRNK